MVVRRLGIVRFRRVVRSLLPCVMCRAGLFCRVFEVTAALGHRGYDVTARELHVPSIGNATIFSSTPLRNLDNPMLLCLF